MNDDWRNEHGKVISDFLAYLNKCSGDYILKDGTSLMMCYGLDRFSEDIDLDCARSKQIKNIVEDFCNQMGILRFYRLSADIAGAFTGTMRVYEFWIILSAMKKSPSIYKKENSLLKRNRVFGLSPKCLQKIHIIVG